jgi:hypothetical protein
VSGCTFLITENFEPYYGELRGKGYGLAGIVEPSALDHQDARGELVWGGRGGNEGVKRKSWSHNGTLRTHAGRFLPSNHGNGCNVRRIVMTSTMGTARPTTRSSLSVSEAGTAPFDPASSCLCFFGRLDPANPFIARQRRDVLPRLQRFCVGGQRLFQVCGQVMDHTA